MSAAIVIAHRGASGYLPEHSLASKALAYGLGADFLEQDVVATRDAQLVVLHDLHLDDVTDVARCFSGRQRADGRHYVVDFDLAELKTLTLFERRQPGRVEPRFPRRFPGTSGVGQIVTLDEEIQLIHGLNRSTGRCVGIYPEIKDPRWHLRHGIDLSELLVAKLAAFSYVGADDPVYLQCFDSGELRRVREQLSSKLKLIQLVGPDAEYQQLLTFDGLRAVASYANGLGPSYSQLVHEQHGRAEVTAVVGWAAAAGLTLHPYTFRADELPHYAKTLEELLTLFLAQVGVGGVFCDHPDVAVQVRDALAASATNTNGQCEKTVLK